jgi:hypothetical protein
LSRIASSEVAIQYSLEVVPTTELVRKYMRLKKKTLSQGRGADVG